jgi:hypothetical protein
MQRREEFAKRMERDVCMAQLQRRISMLRLCSLVQGNWYLYSVPRMAHMGTINKLVQVIR